MTRSVSYAPLLTVDLRHSYYTGGTARGLSLTPTPSTQHVLAGNLCRPRVTPGRFELWFADQGTHAPVRDMPAATILGFTLHSNAPDFDVVTQPDWGSDHVIGQVLYFSNKGATDTSPLTLPSRGAVLLPVRPRGFARPKDASPLTLWRWFDDRKVWTEPEDGPKTGHLNLQDVAEDGRYLLKAGASVVLDFYLSSVPATQMLGALELGWTAAAFGPPQDLPRAVTLAFEARSAVWIYAVITGNGLSLQGATIEHPDGTSAFGAAERRDDIRGRAGWHFRSDAAMPLAERYDPAQRLDLKPPQIGMREPDAVPLPLASPSCMQKDAADGEVFFTMYVVL